MLQKYEVGVRKKEVSRKGRGEEAKVGTVERDEKTLRKAMKMTWITTSTALLPCLRVPFCRCLQHSQQSHRWEPFSAHCSPHTELKWTGCSFSLYKLVNPSWGEDYMHVISNIWSSRGHPVLFGKVRTERPPPAPMVGCLSQVSHHNMTSNIVCPEEALHFFRCCF